MLLTYTRSGRTPPGVVSGRAHVMEVAVAAVTLQRVSPTVTTFMAMSAMNPVPVIVIDAVDPAAKFTVAPDTPANDTSVTVGVEAAACWNVQPAAPAGAVHAEGTPLMSTAAVWGVAEGRRRSSVGMGARKKLGEPSDLVVTVAWRPSPAGG